VYKKILRIDARDNAIVALENLEVGDKIKLDGKDYLITQRIKQKHKFAITDIAINDPITMYGVIVGRAIVPIQSGGAITIDNIKHSAASYSVENKVNINWQPLDVSKWKNRHFKGYHRADGSVGTANYWLVLPLVFCENRNVAKLQNAFNSVLGYHNPDNIYENHVKKIVDLYKNQELNQIKSVFTDKNSTLSKEIQLFKNVDGIKFIYHTSGCGGSNEDCASLARLFASLCFNPNVAGVTVLSLGCQKTQIKDMVNAINDINPNIEKPILYYEQQDYGTEEKMLSAAINETFLQLIEINKIERKPAAIDKLTIGLKCGGSDGFSGISANPTLGVLSDILVSSGGSTILAEFPELVGVEQELINRCVSKQNAEKFVALMQEYEKQANAVGSSLDMNPSAGNIKDGLITDAIKSAGAAKKGGTAPIVDVLNYTEVVKHRGLNLLCSPGNDVIATSAMASSGANIILFTTGLGTPTGNPICPVVKISTNTDIYKKMPDAIDFDCGKVITEDYSLLQMAEELLEYCIKLASGELKTKAQILGQDDFIPWLRGINL
jgi:altronate hydrolase